jgi:hypothetical protein
LINISVLPDIIGLIGVSLVLAAFGLLNMNKMTSHTMLYQLMNLLGSMLLLFSLCFHVNIASVVIEIAWMLISLIGIYRAFNASHHLAGTFSRKEKRCQFHS